MSLVNKINNLLKQTTMNIVLIISTAVFITSLTACSNNKNQKEVTPPVTETRQTSTENNMATAAPKVTTVVPSFTVQNIQGQPVNLQSFKGKKLFVNLWASWCPPCRREMPSIEKLFQSVDTSKVAFVMLSLDDNFDKAKKFIKNQKLKLPIYYPTENLPELFNVQGIPATFIFNEKGELIQRIDGGDDYNSDQYRNMLK